MVAYWQPTVTNVHVVICYYFVTKASMSLSELLKVEASLWCEYMTRQTKNLRRQGASINR